MQLSYFENQVVETGHNLGLDLKGIRKAVEILLCNIKRSNFFRTYTDHSIKHCDQMFSILSWLIPSTLRDELTYAENALLTLSVYFHDMGMLATEEEFRNLSENGAYKRYEQAYTQQYDASSQRDIDHTLWERFLFEEFIRSTHAQRIYDWLTGRHDELPQAKELKSLLRGSTPQFRHYLATICKSHHLNNLHDTSIYPVDARFGNGEKDRANIQFLSVLLRLADILHMSRDRTPPLEFRLISPRNPLSAQEWAKQLQVAGVGPSETDPTEIRIEALCTDHRMYFYLQDFIRIVNDELQRCRAWIGGAPGNIARRYYLTHRIVTDSGVRAEGFLAEKFQLELDQRRVIDLLMGHNLYGDPKVAIRELVQNSIDAVRVRNLETPGYIPRLSVHHNSQANTLTVLDNGIGMDLDIIRRHFLRVGDSYYRSQAFRRRSPGYTPISHFGIGFLTTFMLGDRVEVITRSNRPDAKTYVLYLENIYDLFLVRILDDDSDEALSVCDGGTKITVFLRDDTKIDKLYEQVQQWIVFLELPIYVSVDDEAPQEVWGLRGDTPEEIGESIIAGLNEDSSRYCPIVISKDDVNVTILWEGYKSGTRYLLAPAGRLLLPLTDAFSWVSRERIQRDMQQESIQKIANGGVFLGKELPGLKFKGKARIHYVVDCRGEKRFTPLVSRSGVAIDNSCAAIVGDVVEGLTEWIAKNVSELLESGVSKYFAAYYACQALSELFDYQRSSSNAELILSVFLAMGYARRVPMVLVKEGDEILLKSWEQHAGAPICIGQNVYRNLLKSVTYGYVEFPLPKEVLESLPQSYLVDVGTDIVLRPMFLLYKYSPISVHYDDELKGVFLRCEVMKEDVPEEKLFGGLPVLPFPEGIEDVIAVSFPLAGCINANHKGLNIGKKLVEEIVKRTDEAQRLKAEKLVVDLLRDAGWDMKRHPGVIRPDEGIRRIRRMLSYEWSTVTDVSLTRSDIELLTEARVIREELWSYDY